MSMLLMAKAMSIKVGNPLRKLVLSKLADNASDTGECWPSYQHIADQCEISRRSVIIHIDAMCEVGLLTKESRVGPKGKRSNVYVLTLDGAGAAHRISHSLEPVIDPKIPPVFPRGKNSPQAKLRDEVPVCRTTGCFQASGGGGLSRRQGSPGSRS